MSTAAIIDPFAKELFASMEDSDCAFAAIDYNYNFLYINKLAEKFYGKKRDELLNKNVRVLFPELWEFGPFKNGRKAVAAKQAFQMEYDSPFAKKWVQLTGKPYDNFYTYTYRVIDFKSHLRDQLRNEMKKRK
ncbi:PAS domain S-box protein [Chryseosolibacter indicus]|uniref:PAS domain S-box protein n=1 Tax=Chryseosolibacter indicus TaxID=2782351 RepID=A0ABS5VYB9_9BACT|nr:PAS domain S-box protein [Chryseosolibacter indicus]MBT1706058.1 PAS domain S-box protein [Chryseosolibacter indicus]